MLEVWFAGAIATLIIIPVLFFIITPPVLDFEFKKVGRLAALMIVTTPFIALAWPLVIVLAVVAMIVYAVFTTARIIRHRSLDF